MYKGLFRLLVILTLCLCGRAWAVDYSLPAADFAPCKGSWSRESNTCSSKVIFESGDTLTAGAAMIISANAGFELKENITLGTTAASVSLVSTYGSIVVLADSVVYGSLTTDSGEVNLAGAHIHGSVSGSGTASFNSSQIDGAVQRNNGIIGSNTVFGGNIAVSNGTLTLTGGRILGDITIRGGITLTDVEVLGSITSTNGDIRLSGGSVVGKVVTPCCTVSTNETDLYDGITARSGITISGGTIAGDFYMTSNNSISITGAVMTSGSIEAWNVTLSNSQLGSASEPVSTVANGNYFNVLNGSVVYGSLTVDNTYGTLTIDSSSQVYGTCLAESKPNTNNNVIGICGPIPSAEVHHYRLSYSSQALTCRPHNITVTACSNADCSAIYTGGTSTLMITPEGSPISFTGSTTTTLAIRTQQTVTLSVANASPSASSELLCRVDGGVASANCSLSFADSGLLVEAPDLLAGKTETTLRISGVRKGTSSLECVPAFANVTREVQLWAAHLDPEPDELIGSPKLFVDDLPISSDSASPSVRNFYFHPDGKIKALIRYDDAGRLQLNARYLGSTATQDSGLTMSGHGDFVSQPYGLHISIPEQDSSCDTPTLGGCAALSVNDERVTAGDTFELHVRAVAWEVNDEPLTETALRNNRTTPNFRLSGMRLNTVQAVPAVGQFEYLSPSGVWDPLADGYNHSVGSMVLYVRQREVGIFQLNAVPPPYHGRSIGGGRSGWLGRFTPAYLEVDVENAVVLPGCAGSSFTYQEQSMLFSEGARLKLTGMNRQRNPTNNYDHPDFWRFDQSLEHRLFSSTGRPELDRRTLQGSAPPADCSPNDPFAICKAARLAGDSAFELLPDAVSGDGSRSYLFGGRLSFLRNTAGPQESDLSFATQLRLFIPKEQLEDLDGIHYSLDAGATRADYLTPEQALIGGPQVRLGRLRIDPASGPENQALDLPYWLESWQAPGGTAAQWVKTTDDRCSTPAALGEVLLSDFTGTPALQDADFPVAQRSLEAPTGSPLPSGMIRLPAPGKSGSALVSLSGLAGASPALPWLRFDWHGAGLEAAAARATFGEQVSRRALIFRRELYRQ